MGLVYRCLFTGKNTLAIPALYFLETVAKFRRGILTNDLYSHFDLTAKAIPRILSLKGDVTAPIIQRRLLREKFIRFYLEFISNCSIIVRRDLVAQKNVISGWFKHMNEDDADLIRDTLEVFDKKIIKDSGFNKPLRMNLFNDWVLGHLAGLLSRDDTPTDGKDKIGTTVYNFLVFLVTDSTHGLKHTDKQWYVPELDALEKNDGDKVNNKILFDFIKILKPWDNLQRQNLALEVLSTSPELVTPYFSEDWPFTLDPKLTMFWISSILFLSRVINLPIPAALENSASSQPPLSKTICEHIIPKQLSKSVLSKSLLAPSPLIKYNALQTVVLAFKKLEAVIDLYKAKNWSDGYYELLEEISGRLPEVSTLITAITTIENDSVDNFALLKSATLSTIAYYSKLLPELFTKNKFVLPSKLMSTLEKEDLDGLELVDLQNVLEIQTRLGGLGKWWNKSGDLPYSLFTVLLRVSTVLQSELFTAQIESLIQYLCKPTLIFNQDTKQDVSPISVLVNSLIQSIPQMVDNERAKIWKLLDECVSRCQRSPYKYIDTIASYQKAGNIANANISPFIAVIIEQWKFVDKTTEYKNAQSWLFRYLRDSCVAGSNPEAIRALISKEEFGTLFEKQVLYANKKYGKIQASWEAQFSSSSTFDALLVSFDSKQLASKKITTRLDIFAAKFRIKHDDDKAIQKLLLGKLTHELGPELRKLLLDDEVFVDILSHSSLWGRFFKQLKNWSSSFQQSDYESLVLYLKAKLTSAALSSKDKLRLFESSSYLLDSEFIRQQIDDTIDQPLREFLYIDFVHKASSTQQLSEEEFLSIVDYAVSIHSTSLLIALRNYIDASGSSFVTTPAILTHIHQFCKDSVFSSSRVLQTIIRSVPSADLSHLRMFTDSNLVDDLTFLSVLAEITADDAVQDSAKQQDLQSIYSHGVEISLSALDSPTNAVLLEISIRFLSKIVGGTVLPITSEKIETIVKFAASYTGVETISSGMIELVSKISSLLTTKNKIKPAEERLMKPLRLWGQRTITWLAKRLAEDITIGSKTLSALESLYKAINAYRVNIWLLVPTASLSTMLEIATTRYIDRIEVLKFVAAAIPTSRVLSSAYSTSSISTASSSDKKHLPIDFTKLLQIVLNHDSALVAMELGRDHTQAQGTGIAIAYIVSTLFSIDVTRHSTRAIQERVLALCMGTQRPQDLLLIDILRKIESRVSSSFCDFVYAWEITTSSSLANSLTMASENADGDSVGHPKKNKKRKMDELEDILIGEHTEDELSGVTPLFTVGRSGFEVTFDGGLIQNSIRNFDTSVKFEAKGQDRNETYGAFLDRMKKYSRLVRSEMTYSTEFFLLLVTSSNLLIQNETTLVVENLRAFVESGVLSLVLCSLSHTDENISNLALSLVVATAQGASSETNGGLNANYQDRELITLISNLIFSYVTAAQKKKQADELASTVVVGASKSASATALVPAYLSVPLAIILTSIISSPEHLLYDKAVQAFILHAPSLAAGEVPLFYAIVRATATAEHYGDSLLRELVWYVDTLTCALVDAETLNVYARRGIFEWTLNLAATLPIPQSAVINASGKGLDGTKDSEAVHAIYSSKMYLRAYNQLAHRKIVGLIKRAQEIQGGSAALATRNGVFAWIHNAIAMGGLVQDEQSLLQTSDDAALNTGGASAAAVARQRQENARETEQYVLALEKLGVREWVTFPKAGGARGGRLGWTLSEELPLKY